MHKHSVQFKLRVFWPCKKGLTLESDDFLKFLLLEDYGGLKESRKAQEARLMI